MNRTLEIVSVVLTASSLLLAGCAENQPARITVGGKVLIDGEPLTVGTIRFIPESGRPASSVLLEDGSFELASTVLTDNKVMPGVLPGKQRIEISASEIIDEETVRWHAPKKYASFRTSGLEETLDKTKNDLVIELTWNGEPGPFVEGPEESEENASKADSEDRTNQEEDRAASPDTNGAE